MKRKEGELCKILEEKMKRVKDLKKNGGNLKEEMMRLVEKGVEGHASRERGREMGC